MTRQIDNVIALPGALVVGAGIAGLFTALKLAPCPVTMLAGSPAGASGSSAWAQGGIAAAMGAGDSWQDHAADTIAAGAGLCDPAMVAMVAQEAPARIADLVAMGAPFDRDVHGALELGREAAHGKSRIVHVSGDRAGAEISRTLAARARTTSSIQIVEGFRGLELAMEDGRVAGLFARNGDGGLVLFRTPQVVFATGGLSALYAVTTNPMEARGEGLGMAARAGAVIGDAEFVQFHPTAMAIGRDPAPLATEALRGEGALLVNELGQRIMDGVHDAGEMAPRDVVARVLHRQIAAGHKVFLDCRATIGAAFETRFPTVYAACRSAGIDPATQPIPVAPAAHYHMGGIATDTNGRSSLSGLWALGEVASTGLHGANRLASNSLLEGILFGARVADDIKGLAPVRSILPTTAPTLSSAPITSAPHVLRDVMSRHLGMERDETGMREALAMIGRLERAGHDPVMLNMLAAARLVTAAALARRESRGSHWRSDFLLTTAQGQRSFLTLADAMDVRDAAPAYAARA